MNSQQRANALYESYRSAVHRRTDLLFGGLMLLQFVTGVLAAIFISPRTWAGSISSTHIHMWAALGLGLAFTSVPLVLIGAQRGKPITRYTIAVAQMLFSALLIHLTAGRIETHFHVFGSLAFLAFYRDWRVLVPATIVIAIDHILRGIFWPQSVFGVLTSGVWRSFEHAGWVVFEDIFLGYSCVVGARELMTIARTQIGLEEAREHVEQKVKERTNELSARTVELRASEERFALAVKGSRDGLWDWDLTSNKVYYAPRWKEMLGCHDDEIGDSPQDWFSRIVSGSLAEFDYSMNEFRRGEIDVFDIEIGMQHTDGETRWMRCRAAAVRDEHGVATRLAGSLTDITDLRRAQEELRQLAQHDRLTGLPNRELFVDRVQRAIVRARRYPDHRFAVLFFDFDRFKVVNDSLGHNVGDCLLKSIADRFTSHLRESDTAARFGGDEFVVLLDGLTAIKDAEAKAADLLNVFADPHNLENVEVVSTASIGVVTSDLQYSDAEEMIRDADAAMYQAKLRGKAQYRVFDSAMHADAAARLTTEQELRNAVMHNQFELWYQPIVSLSTGEMCGAEALLRWRHPTKGLVTPDQFMNIAEETGLIIPIGECVLREACRQLKLWSDLGYSSLYINVNVSRRQLVHPDLVPTVQAALEESAIDAQRLRIEITESAVMDARSDPTTVMNRLKDLGILLAMDDFGTGYSSLSCLHSFPIDILKIDREFVSNMTRRREFSAVMHAIITLAQHLNLDVVAEGVETHEQLAQLQTMDCDAAQGYLFSKPVPSNDIPSLVAQRLAAYRAA